MKKFFEFTKMSGAGNDFLVFNNLSGKVLFTQSQRAALCRRGFSVGADGIVIIEKPTTNSAHFRMRYFNANGKEADMCGNGARCAARFAFENKIAPKNMIFESRAGIQQAQILTKGRVRLFMPPPTQLNTHIAIKCGTKAWKGLRVNTGVPHFVTPALKLDALDVQNVGHALRHHKAFGDAGSNINFVSIEKKNSLKIRTFERGVEGETLACGTGSVAAALWAHLTHGARSPVTIKTRGGELKVLFQRSGAEFANVVLEGPTAIVLVGKLGPNAFD